MAKVCAGQCTGGIFSSFWGLTWCCNSTKSCNSGTMATQWLGLGLGYTMAICLVLQHNKRSYSNALMTTLLVCVCAFVLLAHVKCMRMYVQAPLTLSVPPSPTLIQKPTWRIPSPHPSNTGPQAKPWASRLQITLQLCYFQFMKKLIVLNYSYIHWIMVCVHVCVCRVCECVGCVSGYRCALRGMWVLGLDQICFFFYPFCF